MNTEQGEKWITVYIVDRNEVIHSVEIRESVWNSEDKLFSTIIEGGMAIVLKGGRNRLTTYAGFGTEEEAKMFQIAAQKPKA